MSKLRAPWPYYGYKGQIANVVWERLGKVGNYVEPFFGSGAVLLQRPSGPGKREVVNDKYGAVCNFWRAVKEHCNQVAFYAIHPSIESELHARNAYLREQLPDLTARLEGDPDFFDARLAGYWCYVQCMAIGEAAYARGPWVRVDGKLVHRSKANGIRRTVPCNQDRGIQKSIPFHGRQGLLSTHSDAVKWLENLSERLASVKVLCGDWSRVCKPTYTTQHGLTGVYLDPPYDDAWKTYAHVDPLCVEILGWCIENGRDPQFRIILSGYEGTYIDELLNYGWTSYAWKSNGGRVTSGGQSDKNRDRERLLISPHCIQVQDAEQLLFPEAI